MIKKPPKVLPWRFLVSHPAHFIAGGFGSGYSPVAPGTTGTVFAWVSYVLLEMAIGQGWLLGLLLLVSFAIGVWACEKTGRDLGVCDHGSIVIDEIVPFWVVLWFVTLFIDADPYDPKTWAWQTCAFLLFRLYDVLKPQPARYFDVHVKSGFGVMMDDTIAALYTIGSLFFITRLLS